MVKIPIADLRRAVRREVGVLCVEQPKGFTAADLIRTLEPRLRESGEIRRVRHQLEVLCDQGVLFKVDRGIFLEGDETATDTFAPDLAACIWEAFWGAGGVLSLTELLGRLPHKLADRHKVRNHLCSSDRYISDIPLSGFRRYWRVSDRLMRTIPLPGNLQLFELRMLKMRSGPIPEGWGCAALRAFRRRVGFTVRDGRELRGKSIHAVAGDAKLGHALNECFGQADGAISIWWERMVAEMGRKDALAQAWGRIETERDVLVPLVAALDVKAWNAIAAVLNLDPASLSRGSLLPILSDLPESEKN